GGGWCMVRKLQFLPFSAISGIEWRLYEASYATGRPWPNSLWCRSRIRRSTQLGGSLRIFRIVKLGVLGFRCVSRFFSAVARELVLSHVHRREFYSSGSGAGVVVQHAAQPLAALDLTGGVEMARLWADELVRQALMIALTVIVGDEVLNGCTQRLLPEKDHTVQAGLLDAAYKSLRVGVQIGTPRWYLHGLHSSIGNHVQDLSGEQ